MCVLACARSARYAEVRLLLSPILGPPCPTSGPSANLRSDAPQSRTSPRAQRSRPMLF
ncbi:hypothetical protein BV20DRAFT_973653 [Pilatotrama ljubarskyi]|nr:hypothetical protein BV20DRAFT_973653 [Pilatotrama ljubarskyi]